MENLAFAWNEEEEGCLPIPPLDDGAFSPYSPTTSDLLDFFDEFDENGDLRDNLETPQGGSWVKQKKQDRSGKNMQRLIEIIQKEKESKGHSERSYNPIEDDHKKNNIQTCGVSTSLIKGYEKGNWDDGDEAAMMKCKFERTKRKLQDSYQNLEKAKKQRRTQVIEFRPIPEQATYHKAKRLTSRKKNLHLRALKV